MPYKSLEGGYDVALTNSYAPETFPLVSRIDNPEFYSEIRNILAIEASKIVQSKRSDDHFSDIALDSLISAGSIENLMNGTTNLINYVVEKARCGKPVQTMVFLDKSARNGAYLFRRLWKEFEEDGSLTDFEMPDIRFMDIGRSDFGKHNAGSSWALLKDAFEPGQFRESGVLVVDEYVDTGGSTRRAAKTLSDVFHSNADAVAQFIDLPSWYGSDRRGFTGITDVGFYESTERVFDGLRSVDDSQVLALKEIVGKYHDTFPSIFSRAAWNLEAGITDPIHGILLSEQAVISDILSKCSKLGMGDGDDVREFVDSAGGFLARPLRGAELNENNSIYRDMLKRMVRCYYLQLRTKQDALYEAQSSMQIQSIV